MRLRRWLGWMGLCVFSVLTLCACTGKTGGHGTLALAENYTCTVTVVTDDFHWKGKLIKDTAGLYRVTVLSPETMQGVEISRDGSTMALTFEKMRQELPEDAVEGSDFSRLFRLLQVIAQPDRLQYRGRDGEGAKYICTDTLGDFLVKTDADGQIQEIIDTDREFSVYLEEYRAA